MEDTWGRHQTVGTCLLGMDQIAVVQEREAHFQVLAQSDAISALREPPSFLKVCQQLGRGLPLSELDLQDCRNRWLEKSRLR